MTAPAATRIPYRCARNSRCANRVRIEASCPCQCHGQSAMDRRCDTEGGCGHLHSAPKLEGGPILDAVGLCEACANLVAKALGELAMDYTELHFLLASGESGIFSGMVLFSRELQVPIRVSVEALQSSMVREASWWAALVAEALGVTWSQRQMRACRPGFVLQRAAGLLSSSMDTLLRVPMNTYRHHSTGDWIERDGIDGALELFRLHELVRLAAGKTKLIHKLPAPCPRCERMSLVRHNGCEHVTCEGCGLRWDEQNYQRLCLVLAEDYREFAA